MTNDPQQHLLQLSRDLTRSDEKLAKLYELVLDAIRDSHADHRLLLALAALWVAESDDPLRRIDLLRRLSIDLLPTEKAPETSVILERLLASIEQAAISKGNI